MYRRWRRCRCVVGSRCGLDVGRAGLLLEDGVVAQALALALLAVAAGRVALVALCGCCQQVNEWQCRILQCCPRAFGAAANKVSLVGLGRSLTTGSRDEARLSQIGRAHV